MQIVELEMVPLSLRPVLQRLYDMKTTQSALREGVLFSTKRNNYYYDTGTGKVIVLDDDTSYIFRVLFDPTLSAETFLISLTKVDPKLSGFPSFWCQKNDRGMYPWKKVRYLLKRRFPSHLEL